MAESKLRLPIGQSDFRALREHGYAYVDKSAFVTEVLESNAQALLVTRPRRFGKTLNLSMLRCFLEKAAEDRSGLFAGLEVERSEAARPHFQRHPVLSFTLEDVKEATWEGYLARMAAVLAGLYGEHAYLLDSDVLRPHEREGFDAVLSRTAPPEQAVDALRELSGLLARHHGQRVVILIDEYDRSTTRGP